MSPQNVKLIGAVKIATPGALHGKPMLLGVGTPASFAGAVAVVLNGAGRRVRLELSSERAQSIVGVLASDEEQYAIEVHGENDGAYTTVDAYRDGPDVYLIAEGLLLKVAGDEMQCEFLAELNRRVEGHAIASGEIDRPPMRHLVTITPAEADRLKVASGQYEAVVVDRQIVEACLVATFDVRDLAGDSLGRVERRYSSRRGVA